MTVSRYRTILGGLVCGGALAAGYGFAVEPRCFALRRLNLPILLPGSPPLRVLHLSDLHMVPGQRHKKRFLTRLAALAPDMVINTGDSLSAANIPAVTDALGGLLAVPGAFVFGNNDFYLPRPKNPLRYFTSDTRITRAPDLPWRQLATALTSGGWDDVNNRAVVIAAAGHRILIGGTNDAHTDRADYSVIAGAPAAHPDATVRIGITHTPDPTLLDAYAADGYDLVLAGHTHGGQVRIPGFGAIVTNCDLDRSRARGLSRWGAHMWLHVSAGLGTSPYMPVRFACRPEATLITLTARAPHP